MDQWLVGMAESHSGSIIGCLLHKTLLIPPRRYAHSISNHTHTHTHTQTHTPLPPSTPSQRLWPCAISIFALAPIQPSSTQPTVSESQPQKAWPSSHETAACTELLVPCRVASVLDVSCRAVSYSSFALTRTPPNTPLHPVHGGPNRRASLHRR